jgi:ABC-type nitrate/sulfonate/bicarbonate transport system substrate-binding protein
MSSGMPYVSRRKEPLRIGYLPVSDCAPLVYAREAGLFAKYELDVELWRETRWGDLRDKVIFGAFEAAHAPAPIPFLATLGIDSDHCACVSALVMNLEGNAITISRRLWEEGVRDPRTLREHIYQNWGKKTITFAFGSTFSSQHYLLRKWLKSADISPEREVRLVVVPPTQMFPTLKLGYIDGFCVGEPWTSLVVQAEAGFSVATSAALAPLHPEKVLMVRQSFSQGRASEHERMVAAVIEACSFCDRPENRPVLANLLSRPEYLNTPVECLQGSRPVSSPGAAGSPPAPFSLDIFHRDGANDPSDEKAGWTMDLLYELFDQHPPDVCNPMRAPVLKNIFRRDIFERAMAITSVPGKSIAPETRSSATLACCHA